MKLRLVMSRNQDAVCRRCGCTFKRRDQVWVAGQSSNLKYYCLDCEKKMHIEVK